MGKRIGLVVNPTSGKNRGGALGIEVAHRLRAAGHEVLDLSDETAAAARDRALGAIAQGIDVLAVTGGDGMVNLGVNLCADSKTPLAIIAAGTVGWALAYKTGAWRPVPLKDPSASTPTPLGASLLGYGSALLYLGARVPQIVKNQRER